MASGDVPGSGLTEPVSVPVDELRDTPHPSELAEAVLQLELIQPLLPQAHLVPQSVQLLHLLTQSVVQGLSSI